MLRSWQAGLAVSDCRNIQQCELQVWRHHWGLLGIILSHGVGVVVAAGTQVATFMQTNLRNRYPKVYIQNNLKPTEFEKHIPSRAHT
jgi:hypothetical protein